MIRLNGAVIAPCWARARNTDRHHDLSDHCSLAIIAIFFMIVTLVIIAATGAFSGFGVAAVMAVVGAEGTMVVGLAGGMTVGAVGGAAGEDVEGTASLLCQHDARQR